MLAPFSFLGGGLGSKIVAAYNARTRAAGGTVAGTACLVNQVNHLLATPQIVTTYNLRCLAAGGTIAATNCTQTLVTDLQAINID